jgi:hypothetical protein
LFGFCFGVEPFKGAFAVLRPFAELAAGSECLEHEVPPHALVVPFLVLFHTASCSFVLL